MILHTLLVNVCSLENQINCSFLIQETMTLNLLRTAAMRTCTRPPTQWRIDFCPHQTMNGTVEKGPTSTNKKPYLLLAIWKKNSHSYCGAHGRKPYSDSQNSGGLVGILQCTLQRHEKNEECYSTAMAKVVFSPLNLRLNT